MRRLRDIELWKRVAVAALFCVIAPWLFVSWVIHNLELSWFHIFMVSGAESLWVYLCWDISRWIIARWRGDD